MEECDLASSFLLLSWLPLSPRLVAGGSWEPVPTRCHLVEDLPSLLPCLQAGWAWTCLESTTFVANP